MWIIQNGKINRHYKIIKVKRQIKSSHSTGFNKQPKKKTPENMADSLFSCLNLYQGLRFTLL